MSENPKEPPRIEATLTPNEVARALVEWLTRNKGWPTDVRYDNTVFTVGLGKDPNVFSAEIGPMIPEARP